MQTVALLTDGLWPFVIGGMQKHSFYMAKYLARTGIGVTVFHTIPEKSKTIRIEDFFTQEELVRIRFFEIPWPKLKFSFPGHYLYENYLYSMHIYQKISINLEDYDLIYAQGFTTWYLLDRKKQYQSLPLVAVNFHGMEMFQKTPNLAAKLQYLMFKPFVIKNLKEADIVISLGGKLTSIINKYSKSVRAIPIGIESKWLIDEPEPVRGSLRFAFVGRYERRKGIEELTEVLKKLKDDFLFDFIGPIPVQYRIKDTQIHYHGQVQEEETIKTILRKVDVLVCPSWSEGMPTVILEAMASGCAIIATDVGAVSELVDDKNGILIEPGHRNSLSDALIQMIHWDRETVWAMKKNSIEKIRQQFLWEQVIEKAISELSSI